MLKKFQINKQRKSTGTNGIDWSNYHLFSKQYTITKLHSSSIPNKKLWLHEVSLARKEYVEPDDEVTLQAISQRNQMQTFLITEGPLISTIPRDRPVAIQDNRITKEDQLAASIRFLENQQQSVLESHPVQLLPTPSYNKPCSACGNLW